MSVGFIVPLKAKQISSDWKLVEKLLNQTLDSLRNQSLCDFKVALVGHDYPALSVDNSKILDFIKCDFELPKKESHKGKVTHVSHINRIHDRIQKEAEGLRFLYSTYKCQYYMRLDADDLMHKDLVKYVIERENMNGYILKNGYEYFVNRGMLIYKGNMNDICGSTAIIHKNLVVIPPATDPASVNENKIPFFLSHQRVETVCMGNGTPLEPVPFPALLYKLGHGENVSNEFREGKIKALKLRMKLLFKGQPLNDKIKTDFAL